MVTVKCMNTIVTSCKTCNQLRLLLCVIMITVMITVKALSLFVHCLPCSIDCWQT